VDTGWRVEIGEEMGFWGQFVGVEKLYVGTEGGVGALVAAQPREAPVPADPWVSPGRATAEDGVSTGVCEGELEVWSTVMCTTWGIVGSGVVGWEVGNLEIEKGKVVTAK